MDGYIERCNVARIAGWAVGDRKPAELDIFVNGDRVARIRCDIPRPDLITSIANVDAGFSLCFPRLVASYDIVSARFVGGPELRNSPIKPVPYEGCLDLCTKTRLEGWATYEGQPAEVDIFVNERRVARNRCNIARPDLGSTAMDSGFVFLFPQPIETSDDVSVRFPDGTHLMGSPRKAIQHDPTDRDSSEFAPSPMTSDFVDDVLFMEGLGGTKHDAEAVRRYLSLPSAARPDVSWFFDRLFYAKSYPDIGSDLDPLIHFIEFGVAELRNPHPLINLRHIRKVNAEIFPDPPKIDDLLRFLFNNLGDPSQYFSLSYYKAQLEQEENPPKGLLHHFLRRGILCGLKPVPGFAPVIYYGEMREKGFDIRESLRSFVSFNEQPKAEALENDTSAFSATIGEPTIATKQVDLYCLTWNEAKILPFFLRHYEGLVDRFFIFDNGSSDATLSLLAANERVSVSHFDVAGDLFVDQERRMSDTIWHRSRGSARWVIVVDMDEFLYHPDMRGYLDSCAQNQITVIDTVAYEMVADHFPTADLPLTESIVCGVREPFYDKLCIFDPNAIEKTNYGFGRHTAAPAGSVIWPRCKEMMLLHYKRLGVDHVIERHSQLKPGLRSRDLSNRWGHQYLMSRAEIEREFRRLGRDAAPVPGLRGFLAPDLRLEVDGRLLEPSDAEYNTYTFHPPHGKVLRLIAKAKTSPLWPAPTGVPVSRIFIRGSAGVHCIEPDDVALADGWLATERIGPVLVRWITSAAVLPIPHEIGEVQAIEVTLTWPLNFAVRQQ